VCMLLIGVEACIDDLVETTGNYGSRAGQR